MNPHHADNLDFQSIYAEFQPKILRYVNSMVGGADAEDLTQEIMVKVSQSLPGFRGEAKLSTWIYRIATHAAIDCLRSPAYRNRVAAVDTETVDVELEDRNTWTGERVPLAEWQAVRDEMSQCVQEYIQNLPENYRVVLVLCELESLSNQEVAEILEIPLSTVKIRLHRARTRLKKDLLAGCPSYWVEGNEFLPNFGKID